ncbi:methionyl-tRNA synthetase [Perkinsela sp. CCAP 1560/4]|nr:methionyl-tRNA synthetase [Perkinsela sp. CCAP 1560/4]|eukprot:KNH06239.1 methionyl-tRNA synthetase [Perkinsela sp. CCAP 1560/4]
MLYHFDFLPLTTPMPVPFYVTTPIYYVNAVPHIGHVYSTLLADCLARYHRMKGDDVFFLTGTDEHGQKVAKAATERNKTPTEYTDEISATFRSCFAKFNFINHRFIRTTDADHTQMATDMWKLLRANGDIYKGVWEGWYCVSDETFLAAAQIRESTNAAGEVVKVSAESNHPVVPIQEENYIFRLSAYQDQLLDWLNSGPVIVPEFRRQEMIKLCASGLKDVSVSRLRGSCEWAIPCPDDPDHVMYVWLDALSNYLTAVRTAESLATGSISPADFPRWPGVQVLGKDILKFHALYWPAFLFAAGLPPPRKLVVHGWWTKDGAKISKSLHNAFDPVEKITEFGLDPLRFFLLRETAISNDGDYSDAAMAARLNGELADTLGNLVLRCVSRKIIKDGRVPQPGEYDETDVRIQLDLEGLVKKVDECMEGCVVQEALMEIFEVLRAVNAYITKNEPWKVMKTDRVRASTVLYVAQEALRIIALLLSCAMPQVCDDILDQLGVDAASRTGRAMLTFGLLVPGADLGDVRPPSFKKVVLSQ